MMNILQRKKGTTLLLAFEFLLGSTLLNSFRSTSNFATSAFLVRPSPVYTRSHQKIHIPVMWNGPMTQTRLFSVDPSIDYQQRASENDFASPQEIREALLKPKATTTTTYVLDVRGSDEIAEESLDLSSLSPSIQWVTTPCSPAACPALEADPTSFLPEKEATIVVHCASGKRAYRAKQVLTAQGYTKVLNGGGLADMKSYLSSDTEE